MVFVTSVVIWLLETGKYWFVMHAFNFSVSFFALMLMNGIVNLATTIPSAPGYIGTFDAPGIAVLTAYGVDQATAAGYTLVLHVALWLPITLLGAYFLTREGIHWSDSLRAQSRKKSSREGHELSHVRIAECPAPMSPLRMTDDATEHIMKIAIIGAGFGGMAAAYDLRKAGHDVTHL